jgi:DNA polymerase III delta prime subunit
MQDMNSILIYNGTVQTRSQFIQNLLIEWNISPYDIIKLDESENSIGIREVKNFDRRLRLKPQYSQYSVALIENAEKLTLEAQNALLKTLEEPPNQVKIILAITDKSMLIPTIVSRCEFIKLANSQKFDIQDIANLDIFLSDILKQNFGNRLAGLEPYSKNRDSSRDFIDKTITALHTRLISNYGIAQNKQNDISLYIVINLIKKLFIAQNYLTANVNPKAVLDLVFL